MAFETWEPVYERILADFGYDRSGDERARDRLDSLYRDGTADVLDSMEYSDKTVAIAGGAPGLTAQLDTAREADVVVAASVAADRLRDAGVVVDCMVTDLDKNPETARDLSASGTPVAVHAHGDNVPAIERHVPDFDHGSTIPTTQAAPAGAVVNLGGFTDGDRAAFLADALGADRLLFPGWRFDDPRVGAEKARKLRWAEQLLYWLESRRDEQFDVLDGRRSGIDTTGLPI
jgi:uncharacterized Rossmann fold enzyme